MAKTTKKKATPVIKKVVKPVAKKKPFFKSKQTKEEAFNLTLERISQYIKTRAYYIWQETGKPENKEVEIWAKAEHEMLKKIVKGK